ncbi:MAG: hypothetical protein JWQ37_1465 [Blastococcus sp.]|nr:hypothetical protein [Blastococcus sp.]
MGTTQDDSRADEGRDPVKVAPDSPPGLTFDRHLVLEQLGGWRGMVDASLPTVAFIVANAVNGLRTGIWAALGAALLVFLLRLVRRESVQQAVSGLFAVGIAVAIAAASGQARDFFVLGIVRNAVIGVVLLGSIAVRRPLVGVIAEFLAPSHLGAMASQSLPGLRGRLDRARTALHHEVPGDPTVDPATGRRDPDPVPDRPWREDPRLVRAYSWLTVLWGVTFLLRVLVQGLLYQANEVGLLGTTSLVLGLPLTAVDIVVTLWVVARLHRHRCPPVAGTAPAPPAGEAPPGPAA